MNTLNILPERQADFAALVERFGTPDAVVNHAMTLLEWAMEAHTSGKRVATVDDATGDLDLLNFEPLMALKK